MCALGELWMEYFFSSVKSLFSKVSNLFEKESGANGIRCKDPSNGAIQLKPTGVLVCSNTVQSCFFFFQSVHEISSNVNDLKSCQELV